jgi:5'-3' exonuclease
MGIPSYFSHIIKNYPQIIKNAIVDLNFDILLMDCNSIIYDAFYSIEKNIDSKKWSQVQIENAIIVSVIENIHKYISTINPTKLVYIAFDGVAPFAKMDQQRRRRYKTAYMEEVDIKLGKITSKIWNTASITPGTEFMNKLSNMVQSEFSKIVSTCKYIVSGSDKPGEGEHKMFQYLRKMPSDNNANVAVYGLDSDLIMLSIFHTCYTSSIYIFREAPVFLKSSIPIPAGENDSGIYFLDINELSHSILLEMSCLYNFDTRVNDYIFMCFLLGNDFLPHFPAINIRTHGIQVLMDTYRMHIGNYKNRCFIDKHGNILWKWVLLFFQELAKNEEDFIKQEYKSRNKWDSWKWKENTMEEKAKVIENIPIIDRTIEKYINPENENWQSRYYKTLFDKNITQNNINEICKKYLEGLEWVYKYYTIDCPDWHWKYSYNYAPLLGDLIHSIPDKNVVFIADNKNMPFYPEVQLFYVLPRAQLKLLPLHFREYVMKKYMHLYPIEYDFHWAFCRYFWEAHPLLPNISIELLNELCVIRNSMVLA